MADDANPHANSGCELIEGQTSGLEQAVEQIPERGLLTESAAGHPTMLPSVGGHFISQLSVICGCMPKLTALACIGLGIAFLTACSPITYRNQEIPLTKLPLHQLPDGSRTLRVDVESGSAEAERLRTGIAIPGFRVVREGDAGVVVRVWVGPTSFAALEERSTEVQTIVGSGPATWTAWSIVGRMETEQRVTITPDVPSKVCSWNLPEKEPFTYAEDLEVAGRFTSPGAARVSLRRHQARLLTKGQRDAVTSVIKSINYSLADFFATNQTSSYERMAIENEQDPRFSQASSRFRDAIRQHGRDTAALKPAVAESIATWEAIVTAPAAGEPDDQREAQAAAAFNLVVAHIAVGALDVADNWLQKAASLGFDDRELGTLRWRIDDLRARAKPEVQP